MFFKSLKNINVTFLSLTPNSANGSDAAGLKSSSAFVPMLLDVGNSFSSIELTSIKLRAISTLSVLQNTILKQHLAVLMSLRKVLILLTINNTN